MLDPHSGERPDTFYGVKIKELNNYIFITARKTGMHDCKQFLTSVLMEKL
jgi:hypothetical protein